jgi:hypothetical protein
VSAVVLGVAPLCLVVTGCSSVKFGSAAIVGSQRITIATLDTEVTNLTQAAKKYPASFQPSQTAATQETLSWLVRFQINEELARQEGITVSPAQAQTALAQIYATAEAAARSQGVTNVTPELILTANGIPPNKAPELGRYQSIEAQFITQANGGTLPTTTQAQSATTAKLQHAQCLAAKNLNIQINPQFGRMDYSQYMVVTAPSAVSRSAGPSPTASPSGLAPAC